MSRLARFKAVFSQTEKTPKGAIISWLISGDTPQRRRFIAKGNPLTYVYTINWVFFETKIKVQVEKA